MEVVEDEDIATTNSAASKMYGKPPHRMDHHRTLDTTMSSVMMMKVATKGSNLSVETHPPSDTLDSRHDSPKEHDDSDVTMISDIPNNVNLTLSNNSNPMYGNHPTTPSALPVVSLSMRDSRVITVGSRASSNSSSGSAFVREEKVSLAPRFGKLEGRNRHGDPVGEGTDGEPDRHLQELNLNNSSLFSLSGSMDSEFLEHQHHHPDHQHEYLQHPTRLAVGMNSPTSTTDRDFLREAQCPALPNLDEREEMVPNIRRIFGTAVPPLRHRLSNTVHTNQRPPFHPPTVAAATSAFSNNPSSQSLSTPPPPNLPQPPTIPPLNINKFSSHPTLMREHTRSASSPSPTNTIPGIGSFCDNSSLGGREKPVISRCFAWSQDSQDDRRISKRARTTTECQGQTSSNSSPLSTESVEVMLMSSALETIRGHTDHSVEEPSAREILPGQHLGDEDHSSAPPSSSPPTRVHWEEKVEHSNELMSHAVDPQVLFGTSIQNTSNGNEDVAMGDGDYHPTESDIDEFMPPPIATAHSASQYSFDSV